MNSSEKALLDALVGDDLRMRDLAVRKLFFAPRGQMMGPYQKAAFDAIQRKFSGARYSRFDVRTKYETAMSVVLDKLIDILQKEKASYQIPGEMDPGAVDAIPHWTNKYVNFKGFLCLVIEREANRNRTAVDSALGLDPELFTSVSFDDCYRQNSSGDEDMCDRDPDESDGGRAEDSYGELTKMDMSGPEESEIGKEKYDYNESSRRTLLISSLYEAIANLKSDKDKDIIVSIMIGGMPEEEYARRRGVDIDGVYRDKARARDRLIIEMIPYIQHKNKSMVRQYSYMLDDYSRQLLNDIVIREISFKDAAIARNSRASEIQTRFSSAYSKIMKEHNACLSDEIEKIVSEDKILKKAYARYVKSLVKCGAMAEN